ncbi:unnamed protein product [Urochloa humidicola]
MAAATFAGSVRTHPTLGLHRLPLPQDSPRAPALGSDSIGSGRVREDSEMEMRRETVRRLPRVLVLDVLGSAFLLQVSPRRRDGSAAPPGIHIVEE